MQALLAELTSGDDTRAENSIPALTQLGMAVIPALLDLTVDLLPLLNDSAPEVRAATALALCNHPHEDAIEALIRTLADEDTLTAGLAGNALVKIGSPSVPSLLDGMKDAPIGIRILTLRILSEIRDHRAIPVMMKCLGEESAVLQYWAQSGLERLGLDMVYIKP